MESLRSVLAVLLVSVLSASAQTPSPTPAPTTLQYNHDHLKALFLCALFFTCFALVVAGWDYYKRRQAGPIGAAGMGAPGQDTYRAF
jgi:formate hydrogenlyase subunit 3/multisubunit Na+/H+ antiporter MnhD subunit